MSFVKYFYDKKPTHREEPNSLDNKIINCGDLFKYQDASKLKYLEIYDQ